MIVKHQNYLCKYYFLKQNTKIENEQKHKKISPLIKKKKNASIYLSFQH